MFGSYKIMPNLPILGEWESCTANRYASATQPLTPPKSLTMIKW